MVREQNLLNCANNRGITPLLLASELGNTTIILFLLKQKKLDITPVLPSPDSEEIVKRRGQDPS
jgi:hypothetical protein